MSIFPCGWAGITGPGEPGYEKKTGHVNYLHKCKKHFMYIEVCYTGIECYFSTEQRA